MSLDEIKKVINSIRTLPAMPNVVTKALGVIKDPDSGARDLAKVVENDHAVTAELLKLVNSPYFGISKNIQTVNQAISLLGFNEVKSIILACAMKPMMTTQGGKSLWEHSINVAVAAQTIAKKLGRRDYDECFAQGLMHDLGKIVYELYNPKRMMETIIMSKNMQNSLAAEKMVFGFDHQEVGYYLACRWNLPKQISSIMKYHHAPQLSDFRTSANIIYVANRLVQEPLKKPYIEPHVAPKLDFEISDMDGFRRQVMDKAHLLLINLYRV